MKASCSRGAGAGGRGFELRGVGVGGKDVVFEQLFAVEMVVLEGDVERG